MTVEEVERGLRVLTVYEGSPADRGGLSPATSSPTSTAARSPARARRSRRPGSRARRAASVRLTVRTDGDGASSRSRAPWSRSPSCKSEMRRSGGRKIAHVHLAGFTSGAHGEVGDAVPPLLKHGADGVVLDLRDNGGGLLNEAVMISSVFIPDGKIVTTRGRSRPKQVYEATGGAIDEDVPVVVLVNDRSASASEIVTGALQDRDRAKVVGTRTFGKGVFQEIEPLANGGALDITVGEYFLPSGRNLGGGGGRARAPACPRTCRPRTTRTRRATRRCSPRCARRREAPAEAAAPRESGRRRARQARPLLDRRAVLRPRPPASTSTARATRAWAISCCVGARGKHRAPHRAARTSRAT